MGVLVLAGAIGGWWAARYRTPEPDCVEYLTQLGAAFRVYAQDHKGDYLPPMSATQPFVLDVSAVYPEYIDPSPDWLFEGRRAWYLGYATVSEEMGRLLVEGIRAGFDPHKGLKVEGENLYVLRDGMQRFFIRDFEMPAAGTEYAPRIPVIVENPEAHGGAGHVLFSHGQVALMKYPGEYPMTPEFIQALKSF